ncbi:MAG: hypothetical protein J6T01_01950 [Kiritimatiellae bacterium]|nr:hypothetical protein [Kiritimatiellia bacterium]
MFDRWVLFSFLNCKIAARPREARRKTTADDKATAAEAEPLRKALDGMPDFDGK